MSRSRSRLAADWFAKLRENSITGIVENIDVVTVNTAVTDIGTIALGSWTVTQSGTDLVFIYGGTNKFKLTTTGAIVALNDVTAFGTV
jgi:hypothetical protein